MVEIETIGEVMIKNIEYASSIANGMPVDVAESSHEDDLMGKALKKIHLKLISKLVHDDILRPYTLRVSCF